MATSFVIPGPSQLYVRWRCRRCGEREGVARTNIPVTSEWDTAMMQRLLDDLRRVLPVKHQRYCAKAGKPICFAVPDDFVLEPFVPQGKTLIDKK